MYVMTELLRPNQIRNGPKRRKVTDNRDYKVLYRFTKENVEWITHYFYGDDNLDTRGGAVSNEIKMKRFLRYVGDPDFQSGIGEDLGIHQSTVSKIITEVSNKIYERANEWKKFPQTNEELRNAKHHY
ncbi:hypothetical protein QE152_g3766 [Popillia japonica]|uniref:Transposase Helix-turn-helix domain-containing protein n=1 Tax=Popillia japonica TaxID=7064 RepID=A0AAW1N2Y7_POPJA